MNVRRMPIGVMVGAPLLIGLGVFAFTTQEPVTDPSAATPTADASATAEATLDSLATPTEAPYVEPTLPPYPTPTPVVERRGDFRDGAWARVNAGAGDCLNARNQPAVESDWVIVQACLPDGFEGLITGNAVEAEGRWWWYLAGSGWVAEEFLAFVRIADLKVPQAPALAGAGRIAYIRDGDIWLMDADGANQRMIADVSAGKPGDAGYRYPGDLRWSPDGAMISYNVGGGAGTTLHIDWIAPDGRSLRAERFEGIAGGGWSPDGRYIAVLFDAGFEQMGGYRDGLPGTLEVATGARALFASIPASYPAAPEFNHDGTKLLYTSPAVPTSDPNGGPPVEPAHVRITDTSGFEIGRIAMPADGWISQPRWSPIDDRIAFHLSDQDAPSYALYDLAQGRIVQRAPVPRTSDRIGGRCGGADMWRLDWNRDGTAILFSFSDGDTGANGVWTWELATNTTRVTFAASAGPASPGAERRFVFSASGAADAYIFWAREGDAFPSIIAEGARPVWAP